MEQTYVDIMIQSLNKKIMILDKIIELNLLQKKQLEDTQTPVAEFDQTVEEKGKLIEQLEQLDSGFSKLYERVKEQLQANREMYSSHIATMKECIRRITEKSIEIQAQESRNRDLMMQKITFIRASAKNTRVNKKAVNQYYKNMMQLNYIEPQFLDNKN